MSSLCFRDAGQTYRGFPSRLGGLKMAIIKFQAIEKSNGYIASEQITRVKNYKKQLPKCYFFPGGLS